MAEENIFNLKNPKIYNCQLLRYQAGLSSMIIRLDPMDGVEENLIYLGFHTVRYFEGPTSWVGANFQIANKREAVAILSKIGMDIHFFEENPDAFGAYLRTFPLFKIDANNFTVKIVAHFNVTQFGENVWGDMVKKNFGEEA